MRKCSVLVLMLCSIFVIPQFPMESTEPAITPMEELTRPTEQKSIRLYQDQLHPSAVGNSKALGNGADPTVDKYVWGSGGDGFVISDGSGWYTAGTSADMYHGSSTDKDIFLSFYISTTFSSDNAKSIDQIILYIYVASEANEGSEVTRVKALVTNNKAGYGGDAPANYPAAMARNGDWAAERQAGETDTTTFNTAGWRWIGVPSTWLSPGDTGYLTLYLLPLSGWELEAVNDIIYFKMYGSGSGPYLEITYTAWAPPVANAADIVGEPTYLLPGGTYAINTTISDADGRDNLENAYLYISADHTTYRVRFDWDADTYTFSQGEGASYAVLNTTACANETSGATGWKLTWGFNVTRDWQEGHMDYANSAKDTQGKTITNWNNQNTWHTDRLWVHSITANWISEGVDLEDGDYVYISESLNITGYVYWYGTTTVYDLGFGTPRAELVVDGTNEGSTYNCSLDSNGYYNFSYTTPATEDFTWSLDVELDNIPTGMTEGPSNDDGKNPLFLVEATMPVFSAFGDTVSIATHPATIIPYEGAGQILQAAWTLLATNNGQYIREDDSLGTSKKAYFRFRSNYWKYGDFVTYDLACTLLGESETIALSDYHPGETLIESQTADNPAITGTHALTGTNWVDKRAEFYIHAYDGDGDGSYLYLDQLVVNFTSFSGNQVTTRVLNNTMVVDVITLDSQEANTTFAVSDIPTTYSYLYTMPGDADIIDNLSVGNITITNTSVGIYYVYLDTGLTWHEVDFRPQLPDGLGENWDLFTWYMNSTRITTNPQEFSHGTYNLSVYDAFNQLIYQEAVVIASTDAFYITYAPILPMHRVAIKNDDRESYYLNITRAVGGIVTQQPLPPMGEVHFRVYGLVSYANYSITVCKTSDDSQVGEFTLSVPDHSISAIVDYVTEESVDFITVFPSFIEVDQIFSISGWVFWTNGTAITSFTAYCDWGAGDVAISVSGENFYGAHQFTSVATETFTVTVAVTGQANETRTYQTDVQSATFSDTPLISVDLPPTGAVNELIPLFGSIHYASGESATGSAYVYWGDSAVSTKSLSYGTFKANHTYGKTGDFSVGVKYTQDSANYWQNTTIGIWTTDPTDPGNLQLATHSSDPVSVYTVNQLSGETEAFQTVSGFPVNLDLDTSNFALLDQLNSTGEITFYDDWEDGDSTSDPAWTTYGSARGAISSVSAYGDYSWKCQSDAGGGDGLLLDTYSFTDSDYLVAVVKVVGIQASDEYASIILFDTSNNSLLYYDFHTNGYTIADSGVNRRVTIQVEEGEWYTFALNWREDFNRLFGFYPTGTIRIYVSEIDSATAGDAYVLYDLIAFTDDPSLLFGSEYALHAFAQGERDYAMDMGDAWDFQEDTEGWVNVTATDTPFTTNAHLTFENSTTATYMEINVTGQSIDATTYSYLRIRARSNTTGTDHGLTIYDSGGNALGTATDFSCADQWQVFDWTLSTDADWTGIETALKIRVGGLANTGTATIDLDSIWLLTCDPTDFTHYQHTEVDLLDGSQQVTVFPQRQLTLDSGLPDTTRAIVTNAIGSSAEYAIGDSALSLDLVYDPFESYTTEFDTDESENWVEDVDADWSITNGYYYYDGTGTGNAFAYYKDIQIEDGELVASFSFSRGTYGLVGVAFRVQDLRNLYYVEWRDDYDHLKLKKLVDGSSTQLILVAVTFTENTVYELKVRFYDEYFEVYVDGVLKIVHSDTTFLSAGYAGVFGFTDNPSKFYNFAVTSLPDSRDYTILGLEESTQEYFYDELSGLADFEGGTLDGWTISDESSEWYTATEAVQEDDSGTSNLYRASLSIDASEYGYLHTQARANDTDSSITIYDAGSNVVGSAQTLGTAHAVYSWTLSDDADWTGTETQVTLRYGSAPLIGWTDYILLLSDLDYSYKSVQLDQPRVVILFAQGATYFSGTMPDGTGVRFADYNWYVDSTQIYDPLQSLAEGSHTYEVKDAFGQTIVSSTTVTINATQTLNEITVSLPLYKVIFQSQDRIAYYLQVTKNAITKEYGLPPMGQTPDFWLYGHSTPITYTITVKKVADDSNAGDPFSLSVPDNPITRLIDYVNEQTRVLTATIQETGVVNEEVFVYGALRWTNGTSTTGTVTVYWGDDTNSTPTLTNGLFSAAMQYPAPAVYNLSVNYANQWVNGSCAIKLETGLDLAIETYWFDADTDKGLVSITVATNLGTALVNVTENEVSKKTARPEGEAMYYNMATTEGYYNVTVEVYKTGYTTQTLNSSYLVKAASLIMEEYSGVHWVSDTYVQVILHTNWGNCTVTINETAGGATRSFTPAPEGTISWEGDHTENYVNVTLAIDGGVDSLTWYDGYYYIKEKPTPGGVVARITGLTAGDLILPSFLLLGGVFVIGQYNLRRSRSVQARTAWRQDALHRRGAKTEKDLHPYDRRKLREAEDKKFGKPRNIRKRVRRQGDN